MSAIQRKKFAVQPSAISLVVRIMDCRKGEASVIGPTEASMKTPTPSKVKDIT